MKARFIERLKNRIFARGHMSWILMATVASGILASKLLLFSGLSVPMYRYSLAILFSYGMFFLFIYLWLRWNFGSPKSEVSKDPVLDSLDLMEVPIVPMNLNGEKIWTGEGGQFSGGGASGQWDTSPVPTDGSSSSSKSSSGFDFGDIDEGVVLIALIALIAAVSGSAVYLIYQAPEILLEAAFEVALAAGLIRKTKEIQAEGWAYPILRKTWLPFFVVLLMAAGFGYFIKASCPEAASFAEYHAFCGFS